MKLQEDIYPDFYKDYDEVLEEKTDIFIGRKKWLRGQWFNLYRLVHKKEVDNLAFLAHRKSGKTSFLRKFYNVMFSHQREAIPFYYEFSNTLKNGKEVAKEILQSLICQATDFLLGKSYYFKDSKFRKCLKKLHELKDKHEWAENILDRYEFYLEKESRIPDYRCPELFEQVWSFVHRIDGKPCVLIVDEAQEMARYLFGIDHTGKKVIVPCHISVASIYNQQSVWILFSGSRVSELYYNMVGALANRIKRQDFDLLTKDEVFELVTELIAEYKYEDVYPQIHEDIWEITNGHPYYIQSILDPNTFDYDKIIGKAKSFRNHQELKEVLYFEVTHERGKLRRFWENHFIENIEYLDRKKDQQAVSEEEKGLTLKILYYIASNKNERISYEDIERKFGIKHIEEKIQQLINADLVQIEHQSGVVHKLNDNLLSLFLAKRYSDKVLGTKDNAKILNELDELMRKLVGEKFAQIEKIVKTHEKKLEQTEKDTKNFVLKMNTINKRIQSMDGTIQYHLGMKKQNEITRKIEDAIKEEKGIFANIKLLEKLRTIKVYREKDGKACEIDGCALAEVKGEKVVLIIEIKNWKKAIGSPQIKDYLKTIELVQQELECAKSINIYVSESGFSKPAQKMLCKSNIAFGTSEELISKENVVIDGMDSQEKTKEPKPTKTKSKSKTRKNAKVKANKQKRKKKTA